MDGASRNYVSKEGYAGPFKCVAIKCVETAFEWIILQYFRHFDIVDPSVYLLFLYFYLLIIFSLLVRLPEIYSDPKDKTLKDRCTSFPAPCFPIYAMLPSHPQFLFLYPSIISTLDIFFCTLGGRN